MVNNPKLFYNLLHHLRFYIGIQDCILNFQSYQVDTMCHNLLVSLFNRLVFLLLRFYLLLQERRKQVRLVRLLLFIHPGTLFFILTFAMLFAKWKYFKILIIISVSVSKKLFANTRSLTNNASYYLFFFKIWNAIKF